MNNSINSNYGVNVKSNHLGFYGIKKKVMQTFMNTVTNPAAVTGTAVTAAVALSQLVKHDTKNQKIESNLAKVPDSVEEMKDRLAFNTSANLDELKSHVKFMENYINRAADDIAATRYVEFTGVNTPASKFTVYEPDKDGKYHVTQQSKEPDYSITHMGGKYDFYYDKNGREIGETIYNPRTNVREETWVHYNGISIRKDYNPDGTVKGYLLNNNKGKIFKYDANGEVIEINIRDLPVKNTTEKIAVDIERIPSEFAYLRNESKWTTDENGTTVVEFKKGKYMYKGQVDYVQGLVDVVKIGKAAPPKTEMSPEKAKILAKVGFTEDVIGDLKLESEFYGPKLIDEVLDMVVYLEAEIAKGTPITKNLIEKTIDKFSPGASGGSSYVQKCILATVWNKGDNVKKAYQ